MFKGLERKEAIFIASIFMFSLILRLGYFCIYSEEALFERGIHSPPEADGKRYDTIAVNIVKGNGFSRVPGTPTFKKPLYPYFLALIYLILGRNFVVVRIIQAIISSLTCIVVYFIGKEIASKRIGMIASIIAAIYPVFVYLSGLFLTETLFIFLQTLAIYYLIRVVKTPNIKNKAASGFLLGLATLTRPILLLFIPFIFVWAWLVFEEKKVAIINSCIILGFMVLTLLPWTIRNYVASGGKFIPIAVGTGPAFLTGNNPYSRDGTPTRLDEVPEGSNPFALENEDLSEIEVDRLYIKRGLIWIKNNPGPFLRSRLQKTLRFFDYYSHTRRESVSTRYKIIGFLSFVPVLFFGVVGIFLSRKDWRKYSLFYLLIGNYYILALIFTSTVRKRSPIIPILIIFASLALYRLILVLRKVRKGKQNIQTNNF